MVMTTPKNSERIMTGHSEVFVPIQKKKSEQSSHATIEQGGISAPFFHDKYRLNALVSDEETLIDTEWYRFDRKKGVLRVC